MIASALLALMTTAACVQACLPTYSEYAKSCDGALGASCK